MSNAHTQHEQRNNQTSILSKETGLSNHTLSILVIVIPITVGLIILGIVLFCCCKKKKKEEKKVTQSTKKFYIKPKLGQMDLEMQNGAVNDSLSSEKNKMNQKLNKLKTAIFRRIEDENTNEAFNMGGNNMSSTRDLINKTQNDNSYLQYDTVNKTKEILKKKLDVSVRINTQSNIVHLPPHIEEREEAIENPQLNNEGVIRLTEQSADKRNNFQAEQENLNKLKGLTEIDHEEDEVVESSGNKTGFHYMLGSSIFVEPEFRIHRKKDKRLVTDDNKRKHTADRGITDMIDENLAISYPFDDNIDEHIKPSEGVELDEDNIHQHFDLDQTPIPLSTPNNFDFEADMGMNMEGNLDLDNKESFIQYEAINKTKTFLKNKMSNIPNNNYSNNNLTPGQKN